MIKDNLPNKKSRFEQGFYKVKNKQKYRGDLSKVIYRSSFEKNFFKECDDDEKVIEWEAEPLWLEIKYLSPKDGKIHRYYPDVFVKKMINGAVVKFIVEIKPKSHLTKPKKPDFDSIKSLSQRQKAKINYRAKVLRYSIIKSKKTYAEVVAKKLGMKYVFLTEDYIKS